MGAQLVADLAHDFTALGSRHHAPLEKSFGGARHHGLIIGETCHAHAGQRFAGGGAKGNQFAARGVGDPISMAGAGIDCFDVQSFQQIGNSVVGGKHALILSRETRGTGDRQDWQRNSGKRRRKFMPVLSVPYS